MLRYFYEKKNKKILKGNYEKIIAHFTSASFKEELNRLLLDATDFINCYPNQPYAYVQDEYAKYIYTHYKELFLIDDIQFYFKYEFSEKPYDHLGYCLYFENKGKDRLLMCWDIDIEKGVAEKYNKKCIDMGYDPAGWLHERNGVPVFWDKA